MLYTITTNGNDLEQDYSAWPAWEFLHHDSDGWEVHAVDIESMAGAFERHLDQDRTVISYRAAVAAE